MNPNLLEQLASQPQLEPYDLEQRFIIYGVSWQQYEALLQILGDDFPGLRMTYLEGSLELISPSRRHEFNKTVIGSLVEAYLQETRTRYYPLGSTTFPREAQARGAEPDECYCLKSEKSIPDIAIEVVVTTGGIDKLEVYKGLEVPEVWFWENNQFTLYRLQNQEYEVISRREFLPKLDLNLLASCVMQPEPVLPLALLALQF